MADQWRSLLIDEMFPPAVCALLAARGHDAVHVRDRGLDGRPDAVATATPDPYRGLLWPADPAK